MDRVFIIAVRREGLREKATFAGLNTVLLEDECLIVQKLKSGALMEYKLEQVAGKVLSKDLSQREMHYDRRSDRYFIKVDNAVFVVSLEEGVYSPSRRIKKSEFGGARLSSQVESIGPVRTSVRFGGSSVRRVAA